MSYKLDFSKALPIINEETAKVIRGTTIDLFGDIVIGTPVGDPALWNTEYKPAGYVGGSLRFNWQVGINSVPSGELGGEDTSPKGTATRTRELNKISSFKINDKMYFANNLPYAEVVEEGSSTQAPEGMVRVAISGFQRELDKNARKRKAK